MLFEGKRFSVFAKEIELNSGAKASYEVVDHPGAVVILPFLDEETILLIRNYRYAIDKTLIELPAGTLERGEDRNLCALRELEEETGYRANHIDPLFHFYPSPGICNEVLYAFVAKDLTLYSQKLDDKEKIEVIPTPFHSALKMIKEGKIMDAKTIATLFFYNSKN